MIERALIVGGTGMLAEASRWVATRAKQTVLARRGVAPRSAIHTQNVVLGRIATDGGHRWLTKAEIGQGVISAMNAPASTLFIVGA